MAKTKALTKAQHRAIERAPFVATGLPADEPLRRINSVVGRLLSPAKVRATARIVVPGAPHGTNPSAWRTESAEYRVYVVDGEIMLAPPYGDDYVFGRHDAEKPRGGYLQRRPEIRQAADRIAKALQAELEARGCGEAPGAEEVYRQQAERDGRRMGDMALFSRELESVAERLELGGTERLRRALCELSEAIAENCERLAQPEVSTSEHPWP